MKQFAIYEGNMERLIKKINRIRNKCNKYGCDFHFAEVGEEYRTVKNDNGDESVLRFVLVEAEGVAIVNGWKYIASVEHTEKGNIINKACEIEVPERYYTTEAVCEHCNSNRYRKDTFLVMNEETGEFKQVGKSCLKDFTGGMSAEGVAQYTSLFDELIEGEAVIGGMGESYYPVKDYLMYVAETIKHFGYVRTHDSGRSTRDRAFDYYKMEHGGRFFEKEEERIKREMQSVSFNANAADNSELTEKALEWLESRSEDNNYMHNLKTACNLEYTTWKNLGIITSLFPTFNRELEYQAEKAEQEKQRAEQQASEQNSKHIGSIGDRIEIDVHSIECVTSWETQFGTTRIYKIVDTNGNVYTWKTSNLVEEEKAKKVKGTIKSHNEYRGVKQTEITRCKVA
jgi:hypothetical protein